MAAWQNRGFLRPHLGLDFLGLGRSQGPDMGVSGLSPIPMCGQPGGAGVSAQEDRVADREDSNVLQRPQAQRASE